MDYPFRLPGGRVFTVKGWGNLPIELVASLAGVKPVIHCWVEPGEMEYMDGLCSAFGLKRLVYARGGAGSGAERLGLMLGREPRRLKEIAELWDRPQSNPGPQLGYPACCTRFYCDYQAARPGRGDVVLDIHRNTQPRGRLPFLLNNVFYLFSRLWSSGDIEKREAIGRRNPGLDLDSLNVIPWHPCSYRCPESLKKAEAIWATLREVLPELSSVLKACLTRPVLFWDWDRFAVLQGSANGDGLCPYGRVRPPFSLLEPESLGLLREGEHLRRRGRAWEVWTGGSRRAGVLPGSPILLDFSA